MSGKMGKKSRKTRWRTLSIGEGQSDTESTGGDGAKSQTRSRWGAPNSNGAYPKFNSSHSTPTHQNRQNSYSTRHRAEFRANGSFSGSQMKPSGSTRSSSTTSETKITFNEDEYTKITTPRQDVLFKKGYLSKPKPYMQRPLTSAGNSTGDGTPDHQSADGADYPENDLDGFPYPSYGGEMFNPNLYYLNYDVAASGHPVVFYDQFGNSALFYPPPVNLPPQQYHPENTEIPKKRYSVDSVCESASPNNETVENEAEIGETEVFEGARAFPGSEIPEVNEAEVEKDDKILEKKPKRRKSLTENDSSTPEIENNGTENAQIKLNNENSIVTPENIENQEENLIENKVEEVNGQEEVIETQQKVDQNEITSFSVDAEEFIPRNFVPAYNFVPFLPQEIYPGHFMIIPPPAFYPPVTALQPLHPLTNELPPAEIDEETAEEDTKKEETIEIKEKQGIDIAKIVSKLEEAAREQKEREDSEEKEEKSVLKSEETQTDNEDIYKTKNTEIIPKSEEKVEEKQNKVEVKCVKETKESVQSQKQQKTKEVQQIQTNVEKPQNENKLKTNKAPEPQIIPVEYTKPQKQPVIIENVQKNIVNKVLRQNSIDKLENHVKISNNSELSSKSSSAHSGAGIQGPNNLKSPQNGLKLNENNLKKTENNYRYADRLKNTSSFVRGPKNGPTVPRDALSGARAPKSRFSTANSQNPQQKCPRLERALKSLDTSESNVNSISRQNSSNTSGNNAPDEWISVSGKKKRKNIKNEPQTEIFEPPVQSIENGEFSHQNGELPVQIELPIEITELPEKPAVPEVVLTTQISEPEVISISQTVTTVDKPKKDKKEKTGSKKVAKKRVIINDAALPESGVIVKEVPALLPQVEVVEAPDTKSNQENPEILEDRKEVTPKKAPTSPLPAKTIAPTSETKKPKTKKRKNKTPNSLDPTPPIINITNGDLTEDLLTNFESTESTDEPSDFDDVSLELEKMIQKGLYANLEQKLEKNDSFLTNFGGSAPLGGFVGPPRIVNSSVLPFPKIIIPQKSSTAENSPTEKNGTLKNENEVLPKTNTSNGLSITKAVREWMDRTRETTPDVEIFRKPEELRQEVLCKVMDYGNDSNEHLSGVEEENLQFFEEDDILDDEVDTTAKDASVVADELRTRSPSVDLLQCWDYDVAPEIHQDVHREVHHDVEPAEEAIEHYESVYGSARDYDRIRNEILRENSGTFRPRRGDGGLPYRAICCSVM